jgi:hypothetical protein
MDADLVILGADPEQDAANFAKVCATYRQGKLIAAAPKLFEEGGRTISACPKPKD